MSPIHPIWKMWFATCAAWTVFLAVVIIWLPGVGSWPDGIMAAVLYGAMPVGAGSALMYWSIHIAPWTSRQTDRQ